MSTLTPPPTHRRQVARTVAALAGAFLLSAALSSTVLAASPRLLATQITDDVGALSGGAGSVKPALDDLLRTSNVQLWVWFTDTTGSLTAPDFATQTAQLNSFGGNVLLLVIAMSDHSYGYWKSTSIQLSNAQLDSILSTGLETSLRSGDNGGAIVATAAGIHSAMSGTTSGSGAPASGGDSLGTLLAVLLFVAVIASLGWWILYGRKRQAGTGAAGTAAGGPADDIAAMKTADLETLANQALVQTDDAVRDSEQELGLAQAGMGRLSAYADASWHAVAPNIDEAQKRLAAVREAVDEGAKAIAANDLQTAGRAARIGQDALGQGTAFLDAIDRLATELDGAKAQVGQMLADADRDLAQATQASSGSADPALAGRLAQAATLLSGARTALAGPKPDVAAAFAQSRDAHTIADDALAAERTASEQRARDAARLGASITAAQTTLTRASDFIATRRGAVGTDARVRVVW